MSIVLGTDVLFSFDGVHFSAGGIDDPANGHNLAVTDDFAYAEPVPQNPGQPTVATAGVAFNNTVAAFTDTNPNAAATTVVPLPPFTDQQATTTGDLPESAKRQISGEGMPGR